VVGSGNRSELRAGYFTKHGDGAADLLPLGCLYKTQVLRLAKYLKIPKHIIEKVPSAGLWRGQTDEGELGLPYAKLDMIYAGLDLGLKRKEIAEAVGVSIEEVRNFIERERKTAHKLSLPGMPKL
jgi:NAD+ synthase